jgi:oligopeptide transport system ATP-binding protein
MTEISPAPEMKSRSDQAPVLLAVKQLKVYFPSESRIFARDREFVRAVDDVSFQLSPGETLGLVGESGCGKTTLARAVVRLVDATSGSIQFDGSDITHLRGAELRAQRRGFQIIFQDPYASLDPRLPAGEIIGEALDIHKLAPNQKARRERVSALLEAMGLAPEQAARYPREFSGGQRQRLAMARALAVEPRLLVCDEAVSALDVSVQAQIVNLLWDLQQKRGLAYLFIAHDLAVVSHLSHRILVMYLGKIVEVAEAKLLVRSPRHPYTQALISAVPAIDPGLKRHRIVLPGDVPSAVHPPAGCPFHPRCPRAEFPRCQVEAPLLREVTPGQWASCHFA